MMVFLSLGLLTVVPKLVPWHLGLVVMAELLLTNLAPALLVDHIWPCCRSWK